MALFPPIFLDTVVALGVPLPEGKVQYIATGFLYGQATEKTDENGSVLCRLALVTNRHVCEKPTELKVRFNRPIGTSASVYAIPFEAGLWTVHPEADVAVMIIDAEKLHADGIEFNFFTDNLHTVPLEQARDLQISEGDGVFVLGFPLGLAGEERNYGIVRQGIIARVQDWLRGDSKEFLIDASIFPGNSGGPVLTKPETTAIQGTKFNNQCRLIGMVSSYLAHREIAVSEQTGRRRMIFEENSGLGVVVPVDQIQETITLALKNIEMREQNSSVPESR